MAPFKRNAFGSNGTLKDMYDSVYQFIYGKYHGKEATVRDQKVSIGIEFYPDGDGHIVYIDVVPGRELNLDQYKVDHKQDENDTWKTISIDRVKVSGNEIEIGFLADGKGGASSMVDDVELVKTK